VRRNRPPRVRRLDSIPPTPRAAALLESETDKKKLERLIVKYGRKAVGEAADVIDSGRGLFPRERRQRGRPSTFRDDRHIADWIYEVAEEYRQAGSQKAVDDAYRELYEMETDRSEQVGNDHYSKWKRRTEEKVSRGVKAWRAYDQAHKDHPESAKALGYESPTWLTRLK
jgi:hypothetical protein